MAEWKIETQAVTTDDITYMIEADSKEEALEIALNSIEEAGTVSHATILSSQKDYEETLVSGIYCEYCQDTHYPTCGGEIKC